MTMTTIIMIYVILTDKIPASAHFYAFQ